MFHVPEKLRLKHGPAATTAADGNNGLFRVDKGPSHRALEIIASDGMGWEHVSVKARSGQKVRIPDWHEMCYVKNLFWDEEDAVMQLHPRKSQYVNTHPSVLHLWRPIWPYRPIPEPHWALVGGLNGQDVQEGLREAEALWESTRRGYAYQAEGSRWPGVHHGNTSLATQR